jgi:hypothetical protein
MLAPQPEELIYPEYLNADTNDEIIKAVRRNILYGAKVIKICVDCRPYGYTVDEMKLFVAEAAKAGLKVAGHVQTHPGAMRAIEAGIWSIEHSGALDDEAHRAMAQKGIWRVGTETPLTDYHTGNSAQAQNRYKRQEDGIRNAYSNHVKMAFSTDADYYIPGMTRGEVVIDFLKSWKDADIPAKEILKIMTVNGYRVLDMYDKRGPIKPSLPADLIAMRGNPMDNVDALRDIRYVMKDGVFFKKDGVRRRRSSSTAGRLRQARGGFIDSLLIDCAALHDELHAPDGRNLVSRIAIDRDQVGEHSRLYFSDFHMEHLPGGGGRGFERVERGHAEFHHRLEFARVVAMWERTYIAAAKNGYPGV